MIFGTVAAPPDGAYLEIPSTTQQCTKVMGLKYLKSSKGKNTKEIKLANLCSLKYQTTLMISFSVD